MSVAETMTPEELYIIDEVWYRDHMESGDEYYQVPIGTGDAYYERVPRCPDGEIERARYVFKCANLSFRLDGLTYDEDDKLVISATKPRPHFDTWQDYFESLRLEREIPDELEGVI